MDVAAWLQGLGLERYVPAFRDNDVDAEVLRRLTAEDLRELGIASIGHRRRLLDSDRGADRGSVQAYRGARGHGGGRIPRYTTTRRCRTPPADGDVLRLGRLNIPLDPF